MPKPQLELVVIGASAGGLQAVTELIEALRDSLSVPILIVIHTRNGSDSLLPKILSRHTELPVSFAVDRASFENGHIYVCPPDVHLLVSGGMMCLSHGPRENGFRPAVDPLFRTASRAWGSKVLGVVLSGALDDGTYGLKVLKDGGGTAVVQEPAEATFPSMPLSALRVVNVDHVLPVAQIAALIATLSVNGAGEGVTDMARKRRPDTDPEPQELADERNVQDMQDTFGPPTGLTCPDCGGALWEIEDGKLVRYRCHVGHQFTTEGLDAQQTDAVEGALWSAVRVLEEHSDLRKRMALRAEEAGMGVVSGSFEESARDSERQAHTIRELLFSRATPAEATRDNSAKRSTNGKVRPRSRPTRRRAR